MGRRPARERLMMGIRECEQRRDAEPAAFRASCFPSRLRWGAGRRPSPSRFKPGPLRHATRRELSPFEFNQISEWTRLQEVAARRRGNKWGNTQTQGPARPSIHAGWRAGFNTLRGPDLPAF